ncbi:MAG: MerR family transcriptional regulator [Pseudonocardia sp.]|nr:MerR family transcriptional regulator [Pseudonocardia sp.]
MTATSAGPDGRQIHDHSATGAAHPVLLTIGQLARRSGVPVRTIRFWSDEGLVPPSERSRSGYRRYDAAAVARLDLVRTLRELGMGLEDVREVLARRRGVDEVAAAHVRAIDDQIRALRTQRAVCTLLARGALDERGTILMNDLARLSAQQRQQMIDDFVAEVFADTDPNAPGAGIATSMRSLPTELPDDPSTEQVQAWVELADLVSDPAFRARCREMAVAGSDAAAPQMGADPAAVQEHAGAALEAGIDPASPGAAAVLERIGGVAGLDAAARAELADTIDTFSDRRVERYWALLGTLNGWPAREPSVPAFEWFAAALRAPR